MKISLTGAKGFIGQHVHRLALEAGHEVTSITEEEWMDAPEKIQWGDCRIHLAAAGVKPPDRSWMVCMDVNFHKVVALLNAIKDSGQTPRILMAQTIREIEMAERLELWTDSYVVSKRLGGMFAEDWAKEYAGKIILHRITRCYGPGEVEAVADGILAKIND